MSQSPFAAGQTPPSGLQLAPIERHPEFFDHGVIFLIECKLYRIPRNLLLQSEFFRDMFESFSDSGDVEGNYEEKPICPGGVTTLEIESLLSLLNTSVVAAPPELSAAQLGAILHISTKWGFDQARNYAITQIERSGISLLDRIEIAFKCIVPKLLVPAYRDLCTRSDPLSLDEAQRLGMVRYHIISKIREELKPGKVLAIQPVAAPQPRPPSLHSGLPLLAPPPPPPPRGSRPVWAFCSSCNKGGVPCCDCHSSKPKVLWTCPIEVDSELQKHAAELGLAPGPSIDGEWDKGHSRAESPWD